MQKIKQIVRFVIDFYSFFGKRIYYKNYEKISEFYLSKKFHKNRKHGLSAMMRLKNEEKWIHYAISSIIDYVDEIVVVLQNSSDKTEDIIRTFNSDKIKIFYFPYDSFPSGSFHYNFLKNSIFNKAYYYNFALSKTNYSYVWKWDGDQAAYEERVKEIRDIVDSKEFDIIHFFGYDIYGKDLDYLCTEPFCSNEPYIFKVSRRTFYFSGFKTEEFSYPLFFNFRKIKIYNYKKPLFIHFKYVDGIEKWIDIFKFDPLLLAWCKNKRKGSKFNDTYPKVLNNYFNRS